MIELARDGQQPDPRLVEARLIHREAGARAAWPALWISGEFSTSASLVIAAGPSDVVASWTFPSSVARVEAEVAELQPDGRHLAGADVRAGLPLGGEPEAPAVQAVPGEREREVRGLVPGHQQRGLRGANPRWMTVRPCRPQSKAVSRPSGSTDTAAAGCQTAL